jgi:ATP-dependent Lhr-like helicase
MVNTPDKLHPGLKQRIAEKRWSGLSPIQQAAFEPLYAGEDAILAAPTAGGKTEAVFFPLLSREATKSTEGVRILYLAPLRALLNNVELRADEYSKACGISSFKWHGDVDNRAKWANFESSAPLLLTTPESLEAIFLGKPGWEKVFKNLSAVVIDEAHNFAAGDRGCHLVCLLERLEDGIQRAPQRIALTATIGNPQRMLTWLGGKKRAPGMRIQVTGGPKRAKDFELKFFDSSGEDEKTPEDELAAVRLFRTLRDELPGNRSLVFLRSRNATEAYAKAFAVEARSYRGVIPTIRTHHGSVSKFYREEAESLIQLKGHSGINAILSTSTLELGIDIGELDKVIQIGSTPSSSAFLQRVGRTGRRPGKSQYFKGLIEDADDLVVMTGVMSLGLKGESEALVFPGKAFHILVHQIMCLARQKLGVSSARAWSILKNADCFSGISREEFDALIAHLLQIELLRDVDGDLVIGEKGEKLFLGAGARRLFAVFETGPMYVVMAGNVEIGYLSSGFVEGLADDLPFYFVLAGILWMAIKVDREHHSLVAERSKDGVPPAWNSFGGMDVPFETAQEIGQLLVSCAALGFLDDSAKSVFELRSHQIVTTGWKLREVINDISETNAGRWITFAGDKINRTFAKYLVASGLVPPKKISADYEAIEFHSYKSDLPLNKTINEMWRKIANSSVRELTELLAVVASSKPYSRLTAQLPEKQLRELYVDRALDVKGTVEFARISLGKGNL